MKVFRMSGNPILSPSRFIAHFSPEDFLRSRELAAGFAFQQMRKMFLSRNDYCSALLAAAVFGWDRLRRLTPHSPEDFFRKDLKEIAGRGASAAEVPDRDCMNLLTDLRVLARRTGLPEDDSARLFYLLGTGYLLAGKTLQQAPLTPELARAAYLKEPVSEDGPEAWFIPAPDGEIRLPARTAPYRVLLDPEKAAARLSDGNPIRPRRLTAEPHRQGNRSVSVILELYQGNAGLPPERVEIQPGDYRYLSFVGNIPFLLHPVSVKCDGACLSRRGDRLLLHSDGQDRVYPAGQDVICLAPEKDAAGFVTVSPDGADYSRYSLRKMFEPLISRGIVEVQIKDGVCYMLRDDGSVLTDRSRGKKIRSGAVSLTEVIP